MSRWHLASLVDVWCEQENPMDEKQFDTMVRALGTSSRRRGMFKAAAGSALGLVGLSALSDRALARYCDGNKDCRGNDVCDKPNKRCVECVKDRHCASGQKCTRNNNCKNR
jgi:hypothetical protein